MYKKYSSIYNIEFSRIDPLGQPKVTAWRDRCFCTYRPSVRPSLLSKSRKTKQKENKKKTMLANGETVGLAEWIIDDIFIILMIWKICLQASFGNSKKNFKLLNFLSPTSTKVKQNKKA